MKITYDPEADALYIGLKDELPAIDSIDIEDGVVADLGEDGHIIGLEILDARKRFTADELNKVVYKNLVTEKASVTTLPS